jgi:hypothetical protein
MWIPIALGATGLLLSVIAVTAAFIDRCRNGRRT